jgi:geranylgeranyl diphosphate synthase type I
MVLDEFIRQIIPAVDAEIFANINQFSEDRYKTLAEMLLYHLGFLGEGDRKQAQGKRIRPLLVTLCAEAAGGEWRLSLPAAAAVELLHNFSLIHDDIQDQSLQRRGRPTVWAKWGIAQAINAGDLLFTIANQALLRLPDENLIVQATEILLRTSVMLTKGQFLDLSYEHERTLPLEDYWPMISGKTAALLAASCELGALTVNAGSERQASFYQYGKFLGLAFQVQDDWLGIWGNEGLTGKSTESDLLSGKKTLPVVFALGKNGKFSDRWKKGDISPGEVAWLADLLVEEGAQAYTNEKKTELTAEAIKWLEKAQINPLLGEALNELTNELIGRTH